MLWPWQKFIPLADVVAAAVTLDRRLAVIVACTDEEWVTAPHFSESEDAWGRKWDRAVFPLEWHFTQRMNHPGVVMTLEYALGVCRDTLRRVGELERRNNAR